MRRKAKKAKEALGNWKRKHLTRLRHERHDWWLAITLACGAGTAATVMMAMSMKTGSKAMAIMGANSEIIAQMGNVSTGFWQLAGVAMIGSGICYWIRPKRDIS